MEISLEAAVEVTLEGEIGLLSTPELAGALSSTLELAVEIALKIAFEVGVRVEVAGGDGNSLGDGKTKTLVGDLGLGVKAKFVHPPK